MLWSGTVSENTPLTIETPFDLRITGVCLGKGAKKGERVFLGMTHEDFIEEEPRTAVVCSLSLGGTENVQLDLVLDEGEPLAFTVSGSATLHLTGYYVIEENDDEEGMMEQLGMFDDEEEDEEGDDLVAMEEDDESDDDEEIPRIEDIEQSILEKVRAKQEAAASRKRKEAPAAATPTPSPSKKKQKTETPPVTPTKSPKAEKKAGTPQKTRVQNLKGGTVAEILTPGKGSQGAQKGQKITVRYVGKLTNGKQFDAGKFSFKLGKGEVIKELGRDNNYDFDYQRNVFYKDENKENEEVQDGDEMVLYLIALGLQTLSLQHSSLNAKHDSAHINHLSGGGSSASQPTFSHCCRLSRHRCQHHP